MTHYIVTAPELSTLQCLVLVYFVMILNCWVLLYMFMNTRNPNGNKTARTFWDVPFRQSVLTVLVLFVTFLPNRNVSCNTIFICICDVVI